MSEVEVTPEVVAEQKAPEMSAAEEAAMKFTQLLPYIKKIADASNSKGSLVRVIHALAEFPLGASRPRLLNDNERQLFQIMQELNKYKTDVLNEIIKTKVPSTGEGKTDERTEKE